MLFRKSVLIFFTAFILSNLLAPKANAAVVRDVTINAVSSEFTSGTTDQRRATNLVSSTGLFGDYHTATAQASMWLSSPTTTGAYSNAFVTFDLGSDHTLAAMKVWNYNESVIARGIQRANISISSDNATFTTNFPNVSFTRAPGFFTNFAQTINLGGVSARYVRINVITNWYTGGTAENRVGLSKVQFIDDSVPPVALAATRSFSGDKVTVHFSETVSPSTATNVSNYSVFNGTNVATIFSATLDTYSNIVYLQTSALDPGWGYTLSVQNVRDAGNVISITNSLLVIESELALWLKADAGVVAGGSNLVSEWNDQSGNGNMAQQANSLFMPTLVPNALNGNPVLHFSGSTTSTNYLDVTNNWTLQVRRDVTVYGVVRADDFTVFNTILSKAFVNQPAPFDFYLATTTGQPRFLRGNGGNNSSVVGTKNTTAGSNPTNFYIVSAVISGTNGTAFLNGAVNGTATLTTGISDAGHVLRVGAREDGGTKLKGDLAEVIFIRGALSTSERLAMDSYLGTKYGIPIISLNITEQPTNATALQGRAATFYVKVSANNPAITYQWQKGTNDIVGATNATYTIPSVTLADDNTSYRVLVSIPGTSQLSTSAILTVIPDQAGPTVVSAGKKIWSPSEVVVVFSEPIAESIATNLSNFSIDNGITLTSATLQTNLTTVKLAINPPLADAQAYSLTIQNVQDLFGNAMNQATIPIGFYPAPAFWMRADQGVTTDGSGFITQWNDFSGNGNNATPSFGAAFSPLLVTNAINGKPAARFDGTNSVSLFAPSSPSLAITGDLSIFTILKLEDYSRHCGIIGKTTGNQPASYDYYIVQGSGLPRLYRGNGAGASAQVTSTTGLSLGVPHVVSVVMQGSTITHFLDGQTNGTGTINVARADNGNGLGIGTRENFETKMKGDIAEILVFASALPTEETALLTDFLATRNGLFLGTVPQLQVTSSGPQVSISWAVPGVPFVLESASALDGSWLSVTNPVSSANGTNSLTFTASTSQKFYRLRKE